MWRAGAGYQYEDTTILGFAHTAMGHWNYIDLPILPVTGEVSADNYASTYSHGNESARPGYYQVYLDRYGVNAELTSTLHAGYHKYTFKEDAPKRLLINVAHNQNPVRHWEIEKVTDNAFAGRQGGVYYYGVTNLPIDSIAIIRSEGERRRSVPVAVADFSDNIGKEPLEVKIGISYVSTDNAKLNLEQEMKGKDFEAVCKEANDTWAAHLGKVKVEGGDERTKGLFYTTLYRASLMPRLESDVNGEYRDNRHEVVKESDFNYYSNPALGREP